MSFVLEAIREKPVLLHPLNGAGPYTDHSGYGRNVLVVGTPGSHPGLTAGCARAPVVGNFARLDFASPVFREGHETQSFSIGAWVHPLVNEPAARRVLGTSGDAAGIIISGTRIAFVTKYLTAPEARAEYDLQQIRAVYAIGVHTSDKNSLYINGELVAEVSLTEEQQADQFLPTGGWLYSGVNGEGQGFAINGVVAYASALITEAVGRHYMIGRQLPESEGITIANAGEIVPVSLENADVFADHWWSTEEDWTISGKFFNTAVDGDRLIPAFDLEVSQAGNWTDTFAFTAANTTSIYGVVLNWDGEGAVVEVSLDGLAWEQVQRGVKANTIPQGFDPTDELLLVRVSFPGGIIDDTSYVDNLNVVGLRSGVVSALNGRTLTLQNATQERDYPLLDFHDNWGMEIGPGGSLTISPDTSANPIPLRTLEIWYKRIEATAPSINVAGTSYINGEQSSTLPIGQWTLRHIVLPADHVGDLTITGPAQVGQVGIYETALTAAQVASIYSEYFGANTLQVRDNSVIGVQESAEAVKIYAHDWTISGSG